MKKKIIITLICVVVVSLLSITCSAYFTSDLNTIDVSSYFTSSSVVAALPPYGGDYGYWELDNSFMLFDGQYVKCSNVNYLVLCPLYTGETSYSNFEITFKRSGYSETYGISITVDSSYTLISIDETNDIGNLYSTTFYYCVSERPNIVISFANLLNALYSNSSYFSSSNPCYSFSLTCSDDTCSCESYVSLSVSSSGGSGSTCTRPHITDSNGDGYDDSSYNAGVQFGKNTYGKVDANGDGYDDPSYTAGYNAGLSAGGGSSSVSACTINHAWIGDDNIAIDAGEVDGIVKNGVCTCWLKGYVNGIRSIRDYGTLPKIVTDHVPDIADTGFKKGYDTGLLKAVEIYGTDENGDGYIDASYNAGYTAGASSSDGYSTGFEAGKAWQLNYDESSGAVSDFFSDVGGTIISSFLYVGSNIKILGITLLSLIGIIVLGAVVFFVWGKVKS